MKSNFFGIIFGYIIVIITGYLIGGALYANFIYITGLEVTYFSFITWQIIAILIAIRYKKEIILKFQKKKKQKKKDDK